MRILFVGDYDMAGRAIATRLYREGNRICWLTQESQKDLWDKRVSGQVFRREISYRTCRQILQGESIDCLVFLTAAWREDCLEENRQERPSLLSQMDPVLRAAASVKLGCVCMLSSLDLRQEELLSPTLEELRAGERVLQAFCRDNRLPVLVLRVGCLFGEGLTEDAGFAGQALASMGKGQKVFCPFAADATFDFLCDSDLADAAYRLLGLNARGVYEVAVGRPVTAQKLYALAAEAADYHGEVEFGDLPHSCQGVQAQRVRDMCGWMPFYLFEEKGLGFLIHCRMAAENHQESAPEKRRRWKERWPLLMETAQNLLLFVLSLFLSSYTAGWNDLRYVDIRLLYVVVVAITFGMRQGILATVLAIASYVVTLVRSQIDVSYVFYSVESWIPFIVYGVAGAFGGYWSDKKNDDYDGLMGQYQEQGERYAFLKELYRDVVDVKNNLQKQIVISRDSLGHLYSITRELSSLSPRTVCLRTVRVMEEIMGCQSAALYLKSRGEDDFGRLVACSAGLSARLAPSIDFRQYPKLGEVMREKKLYVNTELDPDYPAFAMSVWDGEEAVALAALYELPPDRYTTYYRNLFETLVQMIQDNLAKAFRYQEENWDKIYLPGTSILTAKGFERELASLRQAREEYDYPVSAARIRAATPMGIQALYRKVSPLLRGTDLLGLREDGSLWAIFLYVNRNNRPILERRFANNGFSLEWAD